MRIELDLSAAGDWFHANLPWSVMGAVAAWYWVTGQLIRVTYKKRPTWFCCQYCRRRTIGGHMCAMADGNAMITWFFSPVLPALLVVWVAFWAISLGAVPPPWAAWRNK